MNSVLPAIDAANIEDICELSPMQEGMLFHKLRDPEDDIYAITRVYALDGPLDEDVLCATWQRLVDRHAALRTAFVYSGLSKPLQVVHKAATLRVRKRDWRRLSPVDEDAAFAELVRDESSRQLSLHDPPLLELTIVRRSEDTHRLVLRAHHLVLDAYSAEVLMRESAQIYEALVLGAPVRLPPAEPYAKFIGWLQRQDRSDAERFWSRELAGSSAPSQQWLRATPTELTHPPAGRIDGTLSQPSTARLRALARSERVTVSAVVHAAWSIELALHTGEDDVLFGTTVAGRSSALRGVESIVGLLINTVPVRVRLERDQRAGELLTQLQATLGRVRKYGQSPLVEVHKWSGIPRERPLFETLVVMEPRRASTGPSEHGLVPGFRLLGFSDRTSYPVTLCVDDGGSSMNLSLLHDQSRLPADHASSLMSRLLRVLTRLPGASDTAAGKLMTPTASERRRLLRDGRGASPRRSARGRLEAPFERQAEINANKPCLVHAGRALTYGEVEDRANLLADRLRAAGVGPETVVGLWSPRTAHVMVALIAILKAGGAYLPVEPTQPPQQAAAMLSAAGVGVLVADPSLAGALPESDYTILPIDAPDRTARGAPRPSQALRGSDSQLAYVLFTSGSTGRPKGVAVEHRSARNLLDWAATSFSLEGHGRVLAATSLTFDCSLVELLLPLSLGGVAVIVDHLLDLPAVRQAGRIDLLNGVPSVVAELLRAGGLPGSARTILLGGETPSGELVRRLYARPGVERVINVYGPTEGTVYATHRTIGPETIGPAPIGRPIAGAAVYVLDASGQPCPVGVPGELYVGGVGVARGYLGRPALTAERFVPDPFSDRPGARMYRSGDIARLRADGDLEYLGRRDRQVKLHGVRVEPEALEDALREHADVLAAAVVVDRSGRAPRLVAYIVSDREPAPSTATLRGELRRKLPLALLPAQVVVVDRLPLLPSGKLDASALPAPTVSTPSYVAARTSTETALATIWSELLNVPRVGIHDNFFELGGDSLLAVRAVANVNRRLGRDTSVSTLLEAPTLRELAVALDGPERLDRTLVALGRNGAAPPLFLVHPSSGSVACYGGLAQQLRTSRPVYGLQVVEASGTAPTVEILARQYVDAIREIQPSGRYRLAGWSFGGLVALEMARRIAAAGDGVAWLGLLDSFIDAPAEVDDSDLALEIGCPDELLSADEQTRPQLLLAAPASGLLGTELTAEHLSVMSRVYARHMAAMRQYVPARYGDPVTLFVATQRFRHGLPDPSSAWRKVASRLEVVPVPGDHYSMLDQPHVSSLAARISVSLLEAEEETIPV